MATGCYQREREPRVDSLTCGRARDSPSFSSSFFATIASACGGLPQLSDYRQRSIPLAQTSFLYASDGSLITELHAGVDRVVLSRTQMPQTIRDAVVAIEDKRFYYHHGFDLRAIVRAAYADVSAGRIVEGGSTITQQLVKQLYVGDDETLRRKIDEAVAGLAARGPAHEGPDPRRSTSTRCTSGRAHTASRRPRARTSRSTRRTSPSPQSAMLAGLIRAPNDFDPFAHPGARAGAAQQRAAADARAGR